MSKYKIKPFLNKLHPFIMGNSYTISMMPFNINYPQRHTRYIYGNIIYNKNKKQNKRNNNNKNNQNFNHNINKNMNNNKTVNENNKDDELNWRLKGLFIEFLFKKIEQHPLVMNTNLLLILLKELMEWFLELKILEKFMKL